MTATSFAGFMAALPIYVECHALLQERGLFQWQLPQPASPPAPVEVQKYMEKISKKASMFKDPHAFYEDDERRAGRRFAVGDRVIYHKQFLWQTGRGALDERGHWTGSVTNAEGTFVTVIWDYDREPWSILPWNLMHAREAMAR